MTKKLDIQKKQSASHKCHLPCKNGRNVSREINITRKSKNENLAVVSLALFYIAGYCCKFEPYGVKVLRELFHIINKKDYFIFSLHFL